jgi:hypothetical protein
MDEWTDMMKLIPDFCNFVNMPKNSVPTLQKSTQLHYKDQLICKLISVVYKNNCHSF